MPDTVDLPLILAFDTSVAHCAAVLIRGDAVLVNRVEVMARGQAEHLMPMLEQMLATAGVTWGDLAAIGVGTGPGNFTGIRIGVAAARGLALALGIPAVGVSGFDVAAPEADQPFWAVIEAPRDMVYVQRRAAQMATPRLIPAAEVAQLDAPLARLADIPASEMVRRIAETARSSYRSALARPTPVYVRPADALPSSEPPLVILP
ncbi:MAG: tRNA (adenosine(37)-N6)-threonylcarbamoyltransferase complex dimerization subunit type 1 TsaB [Pseudorhodobacter sp.]|nr:tRNA (adenosine(37)-N6)-threonylcarbamoyltransferase complex dimerization subunit type 1 TsaB [Pseudorhodobacter sp.]